ncbi:MAG: STAS/SEC14 domain-containing protein [Rhodopirellula sp.]|nr:STAS/SEC14 domain-containing protein [Rhodopirellula sp.]
MIRYELRQSEGILIVTPESSLEASDFQGLSEELDPYIEARGKLHGLMIDAESFPGWQDFDGLVAHLKFVESHHKKIEKVAVVSDDSFLSAAPRFAAHFVQAEIKQFPHSEREDALLWLTAAKTAQPASA